MNKRTIIYIIISAICVIAIIAGVYYQIFGSKNDNTNTLTNENNVIVNEDGVIDPEELKKEFNSLFDNSFNDQGYDTSAVTKITGLEEQDIIYAAYNIKEEK